MKPSLLGIVSAIPFLRCPSTTPRHAARISSGECAEPHSTEACRDAFGTLNRYLASMPIIWNIGVLWPSTMCDITSARAIRRTGWRGRSRRRRPRRGTIRYRPIRPTTGPRNRGWWLTFSPSFVTAAQSMHLCEEAAIRLPQAVGRGPDDEVAHHVDRERVAIQDHVVVRRQFLAMRTRGHCPGSSRPRGCSARPGTTARSGSRSGSSSPSSTPRTASPG